MNHYKINIFKKWKLENNNNNALNLKKIHLNFYFLKKFYKNQLKIIK